MNVAIEQKANDQTSWRKVDITGRYVTVLNALYPIEIRARGWNSFLVDDADEIDFGVEFSGGGELFVRNTSELQNDCIIASAPFYIRRKKSVELTADLSNINIASGEVGIDPLKNSVKVVNAVQLETTQVVKVEQQSPVEIEPSQIVKVEQQSPVEIEPSQIVKVENKEKFTLSYLTHILTAVEAVNGWTFNNGTAERLIISATANVQLGFTDFAEGEKIILNDIAPNQNIIFKGQLGDEIDIIKMVRV